MPITLDKIEKMAKYLHKNNVHRTKAIRYMLPYIDMLREEDCTHKDITTRLTRS